MFEPELIFNFMSSPRVSALLVTYNQADYVQEALQSLLDQDWNNLEIVVSDDASTDQTWNRICELCETYVGSKKVVLLRHAKNVGVVENLTTAIAAATGDLFMLAAGDDVSLPTRCRESCEAWMASGRRLDLVATDAYDMLLDGSVVRVKSVDDLETWSVEKWFFRRPYHFGASHLLTRRVVECSPLRPDLSAEDQVLMFRAIMLGGAKRLAKPLVKHRRGGVSTSSGPASYAAKRTALLKSAQRSLIESEQLLQDARICGVLGQACIPLQASIRLQLYAIAMLNAASLLERVNLLIDAQGVPWSKRLRFFIFGSTAWLYKIKFWLKATIQRTS